MDILRALSSPNLDIRKKALDIAMDLITLRNIDEVVAVLKKEIVKTQNKELDKAAEYRQMLVQVNCLHPRLSHDLVLMSSLLPWQHT